MKTILSAAALGAALAFASPLAAQDTQDAPADAGGDRITIGVGAALVPDFEGSDDSSIIPAGVIVGKVSGIDFFTRGTQLYVDLVPDAPGPGTNFEAGLIGGARLDRTNKVDDLQVRALGKIDTAWEVGGFVGVSRTGVITSDYDTLSARVAYVHDVSGTYDSYVITPQITYTTPLSIRTLVSVGASADYVGKGYARTYFAVSPAGALASGLPAYAFNDDGFKRFNLTAFALQSLSGDLRRGWGIGGGVLYGRMLGDFKRSPIVRDANQWSFAAGVTYTF